MHSTIFRDKYGARVQVGQEVMVQRNRLKSTAVRCYVAAIGVLGGVVQAMVQEYGKKKAPFWTESDRAEVIYEIPKILHGTLADWKEGEE